MAYITGGGTDWSKYDYKQYKNNYTFSDGVKWVVLNVIGEGFIDLAFMNMLSGDDAELEIYIDGTLVYYGGGSGSNVLGLVSPSFLTSGTIEGKHQALTVYGPIATGNIFYQDKIEAFPYTIGLNKFCLVDKPIPFYTSFVMKISGNNVNPKCVFAEYRLKK